MTPRRPSSIHVELLKPSQKQAIFHRSSVIAQTMLHAAHPNRHPTPRWHSFWRVRPDRLPSALVGSSLEMVSTSSIVVFSKVFMNTKPGSKCKTVSRTKPPIFTASGFGGEGWGCMWKHQARKGGGRGSWPELGRRKGINMYCM